MTKIKTYPYKPVKGEGICRSLFARALTPVIPAKAGIQTANAVGDAGSAGVSRAKMGWRGAFVWAWRSPLAARRGLAPATPPS